MAKFCEIANMDIYIFTAMILIVGIVIIFVANKMNKDEPQNQSSTDSTGGAMIDDFDSSDSDAGGE